MLVNFAKLIIAGAVIVFVAILLIDRPWLARWLVAYRPRRIPVALLMMTAVIAGIITASLLSPVVLPQQVGALFITSLFLVILLLVLQQLGIWSRRTGAPLVLLLLIGALTFAVFDWNDDHSILVAQPNESDAPRDDGFDVAFKRWLESRADRDPTKSYPV